jgi:hypothetical protein
MRLMPLCLRWQLAHTLVQRSNVYVFVGKGKGDVNGCTTDTMAVVLGAASENGSSIAYCIGAEMARGSKSAACKYSKLAGYCVERSRSSGAGTIAVE